MKSLILTKEDLREGYKDILTCDVEFNHIRYIHNKPIEESFFVVFQGSERTKVLKNNYGYNGIIFPNKMTVGLMYDICEYKHDTKI